MTIRSRALNSGSGRWLAWKLAAFVGMAAVAIPTTSAAPPDYTVLLNHLDGPLPNGGFVTNLLGSPAGTPNDEVYFEANSTHVGLWRYKDGLFTELQNSTQSVGGVPLWPFGGGGSFYWIFTDLAPSGHLAIIDIAVNPPAGAVIFHGLAGGLQLVARQGAGASGIPGGTIKSLPSNLQLLSTTGFGAYSAEVTVPGPADIGAVWRLDNNVLIAKDGDTAPGTTGGQFQGLWSGTPPAASADDEGRVLLLSDLKLGTGDVTIDNDTGIWLSDTLGGNLSLVLRKGAVAPGFSPATIQLFRLGNASQNNGVAIPRINSNGKIALVALATLDGPALQPLPVIYLGTSGSFEPILSTKDDAPGLPGEKILTIDAFYLNDNNQVLFFGNLKLSATVNAFNDEVAYLWTPNPGGGGSWILLAREGMALPDAPGLEIGQISGGILGPFLPVSFGPSGQGSLVVPIRDTGSGTETSARRAILYFTGGLQTIAYEGQTITVNGTPKLLTLLTSSPRSLTGFGRVAFRGWLGGSIVGQGSAQTGKIIVASLTGTPFPAPLPFPTAPDAPPVINVPGKFTGHNGKATLKGTVSAGVTKVEVKAGTGGFDPAQLTGTSWKFKARDLKTGKNSAKIRATGADGQTTIEKTKIVVK